MVCGYVGVERMARFPNLKTLELSNCPELKSVPLDLFPSLKELHISSCMSLESISAAGGTQHNLECLIIEKCPKFAVFPKDGLSAPNLTGIYIFACESLKSVPLDLLPTLQELHISRCINLESILAAGGTQHNLKSRHINGCPKFAVFTEDGLSAPNLTRIDIFECESLKSVPLVLLPSLKKLSIESCMSLESILAAGGTQHHLEYLNIVKCPKFAVFPEDGLSAPNLTWIRIFECESLKSVPLDLLPSLKKLSIRSCMSLESILAAGGTPHSLEFLYIEKCPKFAVFTEDGLSAPNLTRIYIADCESLKWLPVRMDTLLPSLKYLSLRNCPELLLFPEGGLPPNLEALEIYDCEKLVANRGEWDLQRHNPIRDFSIGGKSEDIHSFPEEGLLPTTITRLSLYGSEHLKSLNGKELQKLTGLEVLRIDGCPSIQCLPEEGLPSTLSCLRIYGCPLLKTRCEREKGEDWSKISRIPYIRIE